MAHAQVLVKRPRLSPFWRHFWQMFGVMVAGMLASAAIFVMALGMTWNEATLRHPAAALAVIAAGMSIPIAGWMLYRGMGWRNSSEMAAAMAVPVIPFLCFVWFDVTRSAACGPYCLVAIATMIGLMQYRRADYSREMAHRQ